MLIATQGRTRGTRYYLDERRLGRATLVVLTGLWQCLLAFPAWALLLPGIPLSFPAEIGAGGKFSALRYSMSGRTTVTAFNAQTPANPFQSDADTYSIGDTLLSSDFKATLNNSDGITSAAGSIAATALSNATAAFGTLRGSAVIHLEGGASEAHASTDVEFFDLITVHDKDVISGLNFDITTRVHGDIEGSGIGVAELWIIDVTDHAPKAFELLSGPLYRLRAASVGGEESRDIGELRGAADGSRYWVYGRLHAQADRGLNAFVGPEDFNHVSRADFTHTVQLFIDPSPDSPNAFITSASGFNYLTPVPLPSSMVLVVGPVLISFVFVGARARKQRHGRVQTG